MELIRIQLEDGIAVVKMDHGKNPFGPDIVEEMTKTFFDIRGDPNVRGLVISSTHERFFSIGLDLPNLIDMSKEDFASFMGSYNDMCMDLYSLPIPTLAAVNGHATAGGCILALCCDHRFMAEGRSLMGVNEVKLGVPVPYHADRILHDIIGARNAMEMMSTGDFYTTEMLHVLGVVDRVVPAEELIDRSVDHVRKLASSPKEAFSKIKANRTDAVIARIEEKREVKDREFVELWYSDTVRERLREAMEKF
jgi:enoyl-CoA hydratase/carnithine racemase